jgi:ribosomal protein S18 acetylase RimI-like enzyme
LGVTFPKSFYFQFLYDSSTTSVVAEDGEGNIIGCGTAKVVPKDLSPNPERVGHILTLAVDSAWRRRGIGRDILEVALLCVRLTRRRLYCNLELCVTGCPSKRVQMLS